MLLKRICPCIAVFLFLCVKCFNSSGFGRCPRYSGLRKFNLTKVVGTWYEVERTFCLMELLTSCLAINLWENEKKQLGVTVKTISRWSGSLIISRGIATPSKKVLGMFLYKVDSTLPSIIARYLPGSGIYQFLETDYDNFAIIWTCTELGIYHTDQIWIFGRRREIGATVRMKLYDLLEERGIDTDRLIIPKEHNCTAEELLF